MDQPAPKPAPYFDLDVLRHEASELARTHSGQDSKLRMALVGRMRQLVDDAYAAARRQLEEDGDGRACAAGLSAFQDALIKLAYDFTTNHVYRVENPTAAERMAVVAQGGYGRGLLAPGSDIDLLFLLPYKQTAWGESVAEYMLYLLWDLGFKVGHATRNIDQCVRLSHSDMTIRTALLDARLILGDAPLFADFQHRFRKEVLEGNPRPFVEAKLAEQNVRHARAGASRYLVEPNVKDGKGGLRDLHTLHWLAKHLYPDKAEAEFVEAGVFNRHEYRSFRRCESFLWTVRCELHFLTGRAEERLGFDVQQLMAERLGYKGHAGLSAVERFMKHYFLVAKEVGDLTGIVCSALELKQLKGLPTLDTLLAPFSWRRRAKLRRTSDFRIENGRIYAVSKDAFAKDPVNFIRLFSLADEHQASFSPEVLRQVRSNFRLIDDNLRANPTANRLFMKLLTDSRDPEAVLRKMNEAGVLGRFIPDFGRVVSMMQFNMYHHFTVDEHSDPHHRLSVGHRARQVRHGAPGVERGRAHHRQPPRALCRGAAARHRQGPRRGSFDRRRPHRARARPAAWAQRIGDRDGRLAGRASPLHEPVRAEPRPQRSEDAARFRGAGAEPRAAEAVAAAHRRRHPRGRAGRVDRMEGPAPAHALFRDRAPAWRRPYRRSAAASAWPAPRTSSGSASPAGRSTTSSTSSIATTRLIGSGPISTWSPSTPS